MQFFLNFTFLFIYFLSIVISAAYMHAFIHDFVGATNVSAFQYFSEGLEPGLVKSVACSGMETKLLNCSHVTDTIGFSCSTAGVVCQGLCVCVCAYVHACGCACGRAAVNVCVCMCMCVSWG